MSAVSPPLDASLLALPRDAERSLRELLVASVPDVAPALNLEVRHRGVAVARVACGWADPEARLHPAGPQLRFDLASVTKVVTTTLVLQLVSSGALALDTPLVGVIPEFGTPTPRPVDGGQEPLTRVKIPTPPERRWWSVDPATVIIRQLLAHTSGLAPWRSLFQVAGPTPPPPGTPDDVGRGERQDAVLAAIRTFPFVDRPGSSIRYSDLGFILLGVVVERIHGQALDDVVAEHVAGPLDLAGLGYRPVAAGVPLASIAPTSFDALWRGRRSHGEVEDENAAALDGVSGHAGLFARATDVAAFGQAWLDADPRLGVSQDVRDSALREAAADATDRRGLGWALRHDRGDPTMWSDGVAALAPLGPSSFGHTGFTGTSLAIDPDRSLVIACLTSRVWSGRDNEGFRAFLPRLHGLLADAFPVRST
jgi:serine-type D-Ala-D-Ala carboxypeptidase